MIESERIKFSVPVGKQSPKTALILPGRDMTPAQRLFDEISICYTGDVFVEEIKKRAIRLIGKELSPLNVKIVFAGAILEDGYLLSDYNYFGDGDILHFLIKR